jgi:hypothetical protein
MRRRAGERQEVGRQLALQSNAYALALRNDRYEIASLHLMSPRISTPERRDRLSLLNAFAVVLLTLLGAAGEALGYDRHLKSNISKQRAFAVL